MRSLDGLSVQCDVQVAADTARVWELVTDIELPARFSPELQRVRWLDGVDQPAVNARFEGFNHNELLGEWRTVSYVIELDAPRVFAWAVVDADNRFGGGTADPRTPAATWRFVLDPLADGTRLRHEVRLGPARSGLNSVIEQMPEQEQEIIQFRLDYLRNGMKSTLDGIKALAEQPR